MSASIPFEPARRLSGDSSAPLCYYHGSEQLLFNHEHTIQPMHTGFWYGYLAAQSPIGNSESIRGRNYDATVPVRQ